MRAVLEEGLEAISEETDEGDGYGIFDGGGDCPDSCFEAG